MPLGQLSFTITGTVPGGTVQLSLYADSSLKLSSYYKRNRNTNAHVHADRGANQYADPAHVHADCGADQYARPAHEHTDRGADQYARPAHEHTDHGADQHAHPAHGDADQYANVDSADEHAYPYCISHCDANHAYGDADSDRYRDFDTDAAHANGHTDSNGHTDQSSAPAG